MVYVAILIIIQRFIATRASYKNKKLSTYTIPQDKANICIILQSKCYICFRNNF